jgi:thiamine-phosphate pyrophosphorylase
MIEGRFTFWLIAEPSSMGDSPTPIYRILDAALNRAGEGLRVVEDYVRLVLDDPCLTAQLKALRHDLGTAAGAISSTDRHAARETQLDVGTAISTTRESRRLDAWDVCVASLKRTEQSLRSLEEYGKVIDVGFAGKMEALRYRLYTLEKAVDVGRSSRDRLEGVRLCVLLDGRRSANEFQELVSSLVKAGVGMIQLRDKKLNDLELVERARLLVRLVNEPSPNPSLKGRGTLAIVNDRADIAAAVHADGVHVGQEDLSVKDARAIVGTRMLVGVSTHNIEQAREAVLDGANYLGAGPTFASRTKTFDEFAGLEYLTAVSAEIRLPTFAIGGITATNLPDVLATGASRIAVGAEIVGATDPACAANQLLGMLSTSPRSVRPPAETASLSKPLAPSP